ncbi:LVIVD repeat-containing protein [Halapricum salinum]|uniref:LVIVD repeat-containing protein n=1 Tax=Halapricum salinum TaxID=1457250 RepID=A0A4D6H9I1_9EURY|nr:hypothetical protein [Halapricum salinum]QCC50559.1 hypothetical protein DV733_04565 [Halapricum salinum]
MRRRTYLATTGALLASPLVGGGYGSTDTAAQVETFEPLGSIEIDGTHDAVAGPDGETAYVATLDGFATVDITDPADPTVLANPRGLLADRENGPLQGIYDVKIDGDRLAVAGPANGGPELTGVLLYDVADPASPEQVAFYETDFPIHNMAFDDGVAYLTGNDFVENELVAVDCSDDDPQEVGRWSLLDYDDAWSDVEGYLWVIHDVYVQEGRAYIAHWDAGTWIVDVSDPSAMSAVSQVRGRSHGELASISDPGSEYTELPGNDHYVSVDESADLLAVGSEAWDYDPDDQYVGGPGGIELYDISTPTDPQQLAAIEPPRTPEPTTAGVWTTAHNFDFRNDRLYASWYRGGVSVHDVSDSETPAEMVFWEDRDRVSFFTAMATDDCVIASSISSRNADTTAGLFTFPIPTAETETVATRPRTSTPTPESPTPDTETPADDPSQTTEPADRKTSPGDGSDAAPTTDDSTPSESGSGSGPGFGTLSALTGLAAGGWYALRQRREGDQ